jgi:serine/threonine protein phosphatase PrpC
MSIMIEFTLTQDDKIIVIASDGVFEFLENQSIIEALMPFYEKKQIQQASDHLLNMAHRSWNRNSSIVDDITFVLIFMNYNE